MFSILNENLSRKARLSYLALALVIALAFDFFFWDVQVLGLGFFLFVFIYVLLFSAFSIINKQIRQTWAFALLVPIFVLSLNILFYNNQFVRNFVPLFVAILLFAYSFLLTLRNPEKIKFDLFRLNFLSNISKAIDKLKQIFADLSSHSKEKNSDLYKNVLIGVLVSVPILFVFFGLFMNADAVFASRVHNLFNFQIEPSIVFRIFRTIIITFALGAFFYVLIDVVHKLNKSEKQALKIDKAIAIVILSLVNFLFATFVIIQLRYLFGSSNFVLEQGLNFADYARQGFFQLAWVIVLSAIILLIFYRSASEHSSHIALKLLKVFLILQVAVIAMSALKRMNLYQDVFGFTTLRLYVEWFIYFCVVVLTFTAVSLSINFEFRKFFNIVVIFGIVALCVVSSINVDRMIAKRNIDRYVNEGKELDVCYIQNLSSDALEEFKRLSPEVFIDEKVDSCGLKHGSSHIDSSIYMRDNLMEKYKYDSWKEFNFSVDKLWKLEN